MTKHAAHHAGGMRRMQDERMHKVDVSGGEDGQRLRMGTEDSGERLTQEAHPKRLTHRNGEGKADRQTGWTMASFIVQVQHEYDVDETVRQNRRNTPRKAAWTAGRPWLSFWNKADACCRLCFLVGRLGRLLGRLFGPVEGHERAAEDFIFLIVLSFLVSDENIVF